MDAATGDIRAVEFTSSHEGDGALLPELLARIPDGQAIESVTAPCHDLQANRCRATDVASIIHAAALTRSLLYALRSPLSRSAEMNAY